MMPSATSQPLDPRDDPTSAAPPRDTSCWKGPGKITTIVNGLTFRSNFDSGNLARVILPAEQGGAGGVYQLWTARDCEGGPNTKRNSSWFYFGVAGGSAKQIITMKIMNLNNQNALYKHGMTPVFRLSGNPNWSRLKQKMTFEEEGRHLQLQFQFRFTRDSEEVLFAFCFPYSYADCIKDLERFEDQARRDGMAVQALLTPQAGPTGYLHRELLIRTPEGRRVDLLTVTDCHGILDECEPRIDPHLFPEQVPSKRRPFEFENKDVVFVSARVHPGETPASFVFQGILRFLLDPIDPRAAELRRRFVFKLIPLLNPDGVAAGHFRQDSYGNNLNRHYVNPDPELHSSVYAAKAVVMHHAARPSGRGRLTLYVDLHAHASSRGCFIYGNHLPSLEDQVENQLLPLLMTVYTPHFDFGSCNFTLKHMCRVDSGDSGMSAEGTGRVFYGKHAGVLRSYTLECNYNTGKAMCNHVPPASGGKGADRLASPERKATSPPRYHPEMWRDVGAGFLKALLDVEGASVWSRLPQSKFRSLERARRHLINELRSLPSYREQSLLLRRGASTGSAPAATAAAAATPLPLPPPPPGEVGPALPSPHERKKSGNGDDDPALLARTGSSLVKAPAATVAERVAGSQAAAFSRAAAGKGRKRSVSRPPPPLLPRRPGRSSPVDREIAVPSGSRPGGLVRGPSRSNGGGRGVPMPICVGSSCGSSRSGSGRSSSRPSSRSGGSTVVARRRRSSSPGPGGRPRSLSSREARKKKHAAGHKGRGEGGVGRGRAHGSRTKGPKFSSRSDRGGSSSAATRSVAPRDRSGGRSRRQHELRQGQRPRQALPPQVPPLPKSPCVSSSTRRNQHQYKQEQGCGQLRQEDGQ